MPHVQILESRLRLVLRQMFESGSDAQINCDSVGFYRACRHEMINDCMKELRRKKYIKPVKK